jgi:hypothetical protein
MIQINVIHALERQVIRITNCTKIVLACFFAIILTGCCSTKRLEHWQDGPFSKRLLNYVLIVAVTMNGTNRFFQNTIQAVMTDIGDNGFVSMEVIKNAFPMKDAVENHIFKHPVDYIVAAIMPKAAINTNISGLIILGPNIY